MRGPACNMLGCSGLEFVVAIAFGDMAFGNVAYGDFAYGDSAFGDLAFGDLAFGDDVRSSIGPPTFDPEGRVLT